MFEKEKGSQMASVSIMFAGSSEFGTLDHLISICYILLSRLTKKSQRQLSHKITTDDWRLVMVCLVMTFLICALKLQEVRCEKSL